MKVKIIKVIQGKKLTPLLKKNNMTKAELGRRLNIHKSYFTKIEKEQECISEKLYNKVLLLLKD